jgi:hypothetical protein
MDVDAGEVDTTSEPDVDDPVDTGTTPDGGGEPDVGPERHPAPQVWYLAQKAQKWEVFDEAGRPSRFAPTDEIRAAFDLEHSNKVFVLTDSKLHLLLLRPPRWSEPLELSELHASIEGADIKAAWSDPRRAPDDRIAILGVKGGTPTIWRGRYDLKTDSFTEFGEGETVNWTSTNAPAPEGVTAAWRDNRNTRDWMTGEPPCDVPHDEFQAYIAMVTPMTLHMNDPWYCKDHFAKMPVGMSPAAMAEGFPGVDKFAAATWHGRELFLFAPE